MPRHPHQARPGWRRFAAIRLQLLVTGAIFVLWHILGSRGAGGLPPFVDVAAHVLTLAAAPELWAAVLQTLLSTCAGVAIGAALGVPIGLLIGRSPFAYVSTRLVIDFGRSFPIVALLPVMIMLLGATTTMKIAVAAIACVWPIMIQTSYGARAVDTVVHDTVRAYHIPRWKVLIWVVVPIASPYVVTGIRIAASLAVVVSLAVEVLTRVPGIGREIGQAQSDGATDLALAYIFYSGLLGLLLNSVIAAIEKRQLHWHYRAAAQ